ncbi:MAG: site-2 protease family protein [Blastocatellia bacterium]|nr:site-2 protease family protein [Blastocatellia bacterium]MBK6428949.1 site-2 protease family protein [Blastocatellia bacterium]
MTMDSQFILYVLNFFIVFLFSLSVHESAHAWTSERFGDDTGRSLGRISLNPIVHIDPVGTILFPLMGLFGGFGFGWAKPVPVNPMNWREKDKANFWVSAAGPISNVIIALIVFAILKTLLLLQVVSYAELVIQGDGLWYPIGQLMILAIQLNVVLAVFNLLPIPPLDGSHMLESVLPASAREGFADLRPYGFILLIAAMATGGFGYVLNPILLAVNRLIS